MHGEMPARNPATKPTAISSITPELRPAPPGQAARICRAPGGGWMPRPLFVADAGRVLVSRPADPAASGSGRELPVGARSRPGRSAAAVAPPNLINTG